MAMEHSEILKYNPIRPNETAELEAEIAQLLQALNPPSTTSDLENGKDATIPVSYRGAAQIGASLHREFLQEKQESDVEVSVKSGGGFFAMMRRTLFGWVGNRK